MKKIYILLIFVASFLNSQSLAGKTYNNNIVLKNEIVYAKKNKLEQNSFMSNLTNVNNDIYQNFNIKDDYLCPIKGVKINEHKDWLGFIEYENGDIMAISSPKYTFAYYNKEKDIKKIKNIYVTDFDSKKIIDAKKAFYVFGSKIVSIGGDDVVPFEKEDKAKEFLEKNSGKKIYKFDRMDKNFIDYLEMR